MLPLVLTRALSRVSDSVACLKDPHCCPRVGFVTRLWASTKGPSTQQSCRRQRPSPRATNSPGGQSYTYTSGSHKPFNILWGLRPICPSTASARLPDACGCVVSPVSSLSQPLALV